MIIDSIAEVAVLGTSKKQLTEEQKEWCTAYNISLDKKEQAILQAVYLDAEMSTVGAIVDTEEVGNPISQIDPKENEINDSHTIYIETMMEEFPQLAHGYIQMVHDENKVLPRKFIPKYLDYIRLWKADIRHEASRIAGERGAYLAQFSKRWSFLLPSTIDWATAVHKQRIAYALEYRKRDPKGVLKFIKSDFNENHSAERQELLETLAINLSTEDIPFLRECLQDKSKGVRQVAYMLLVRVDEQVRTEIFEQATPFIQVEKGGFLSKPSLKIVLPENSDWVDQLPAADKRGIQVGKKAEKLLNLASLLPFSYYNAALEKVLQWVTKSEWDKVLLKAMQNAAILFCDSTWALALVPELQKKDIIVEEQLLILLSKSEFNILIKKQIAFYSEQYRYREPLGAIFHSSTQVIDSENSKKLIKQLATYYLKNGIEKYQLYAEDIKIIKSILARMDRSITTLPEELAEFNDLMITKQKLKDSLK